MEVYLTIISIYFWENVIKNVNVGARIPKTLAFNIHLTSILDTILIFFLMNFCLICLGKRTTLFILGLVYYYNTV